MPCFHFHHACVHFPSSCQIWLLHAADNHQEGAEDESNDVAVRSHENDSRSGEDSVPPLMPHEAAEHAHDDNDDMPSLVTSDNSEGDSLPDLDNSDADSFPQSHYNSGDRLPGLEADHDNYDGDSLPSLDNSEADSFPQEHYGSDGDSLPDLEADHDCGSEGSEDHEDAEDSDDYEETDELPALVDFPPPTFAPAVNGAQAFGPNTPLDLDQQAAVDDLSHELDVADALAASVRLVSFFYSMTFQLCVTLCIALYGVRPVQLSPRFELYVNSAVCSVQVRHILCCQVDMQTNLMLSS